MEYLAADQGVGGKFDYGQPLKNWKILKIGYHRIMTDLLGVSRTVIAPKIFRTAAPGATPGATCMSALTSPRAAGLAGRAQCTSSSSSE